MSEPITPPTEEEILAYLYPKSYHCPVCEKDFSDFAVRKSKLRTQKIDSDFYTRYFVMDPNHYEVQFCSHCGYAALANYFDRITDRQQTMIKEKITPHHKPVEFPMPLSMEHVIMRYEQAAKCAEAINAKPSQQAFIFLKTAWVYRSIDEKNKELGNLRIAYGGLKEAFSSENFPLGNMDETTAKYVIADIARRLGLFGEALRWVGDVIVAQGVSSAIKERALLLKDAAKEGNSN